MERTTLKDIARRVRMMVGRGTMRKVEASDDNLWQEITLDLYHDETAERVERVQDYGITSHPRKQTDLDKATPGQQPQGKAAEAVVVYAGGSRSHPVAIAVGDRRYRLRKIKEGEVALYDDLGHQVHLTRDGIVLSAPNSKKIVAQVMKSDDLPKEGEHGQISQTGKEAYAKYTLTKDSFTYEHPDKIEFKVGDTFIRLTKNKIETNADTISNNVTTRFETVGPTFLGLDAKDEIGPKVETVGGPAKKTFAKI